MIIDQHRSYNLVIQNVRQDIQMEYVFQFSYEVWDGTLDSLVKYITAKQTFTYSLRR